MIESDEIRVVFYVLVDTILAQDLKLDVSSVSLFALGLPRRLGHYSSVLLCAFTFVGSYYGVVPCSTEGLSPATNLLVPPQKLKES